MNALHEASHAYARWWMHHPIERVTEEFVQCEPRLRFSAKQCALFRANWDNLICACAGFAGESLAGKSNEFEWLASRDYYKAFEIAKQLSGKDVEAATLLVPWARRMAFVILSEHRKEVTRLASALEAQHTLSGPEVTQVLLTA